MSWANVLPWYLYELEHEEHEAKALCAMEEEIIAGRMRSTPKHWRTIDEMKYAQPERQLSSLGIRL